MIKYLQNTTLAERQMFYYNATKCPYCNGFTDFVDSIEIYQQSYGMVYLCRPCKAWVNVHNQNSDQPFGFVAKRDLRELRHKFHLIFDPLWQLKMTNGAKKNKAQADARRWLAGLLKIDIIECHGGMFDNDRCLQAIKICEDLNQQLAAKQVEKRAFEELNTTMVNNALSGTDIHHQEFVVAGIHKFEIAHPVSRKTFHYYPRTNEYHWEGGKKKPLLEEIEQFLMKNFIPE